MALDRPPRPAAGAVTARVRRAILRAAAELRITPELLLEQHLRAEHLGNAHDLIDDVEERYLMARGELRQRLHKAVTWEPAASVGAPHILVELPDPEFLTVLEDMGGSMDDDLNPGMVEALFTAADQTLRSHGVSYRRVPSAFRFEWIGDPAQHALTVRPALVALADPRLDGARVEFEEALSKRRHGAPKDLEDAVDEAAKSVESTLKILYHETGVPLPTKKQLAGLFSRLAGDDVNVLPGYLDHLILAAGGPRNHMASHGQGGTVREVPEELADASIAAAAVAITLLAHYLP